MIDTVNIHVNIEPPIEVTERIPQPFIWNDIVFSPTYTPRGFIMSYSGKLENLYLTFNDTGLYIGNSWHKFYHGKNWNNYTFTEIVATYEALNDRFNGMIENATIKRLDFGINIAENPAEVYGNWAYLRTKQPETMRYKGKPYGQKFYGSEFSFKGYDKATQVKYQSFLSLPNQITRIEKSVFKMRSLNQRKTSRVEIYTAKDLINQINIRQLANDFLTTYKQIEMKKAINPYGLTTSEKKILGYMDNPQLREAMRKENPETYRKDFRVYKEILRQQNPSNLITDKISEKMEYLAST